MKYSDTKWQLANIFTKPLDVTHFASLWGGDLLFAIPMTWFEGSLCFTLYVLYIIFITLHFIHMYIIYICFTYYTSLYLADYACHCARVSRVEI
jgi:hypothetical protein